MAAAPEGTIVEAPVWSIPSDMSSTVMAASPDGRWILYGGFEIVHVLDALTGVEVASISHGEANVYCLCVSPDSRMFAAGLSNDDVHVVEFVARDGTLRASAEGRKVLRGHTRDIRGCTFSADGTRLVTGSVDATIRVWSLDAAEVDVHSIPQGSWVNAVVAIPRSSLVVAACGGGPARVWDINTLREVRTYVGRSISAAVSQDGRWLATAHESQDVRVWSLVDGRQRVIPTPFGYSTLNVSFSANGKYIAVARHFDCSVWSVNDGVLLHRLGKDIYLSAKGWPVQSEFRAAFRHVAFVGKSPYLLAVTTDKSAAQLWHLRPNFSMPLLAALAHPSWARFFLDDGDHANATRVERFM